MQIKKQGFTLVELIVVISILAILGTIAFLSMQGYSKSARDSARLADVQNIKKVLELFATETGKYPTPTDGVNKTYSGGLVFNEGTFGDTTFSNVGKINKIPLDPSEQMEYGYSLLSTNKEFQIAMILETEDFAMNATANAVEATTALKISGNYNGISAPVKDSSCGFQLIAIPTLFTTDKDITNIEDLLINNSFAINGHKNLPASFKGSRFKIKGEDSNFKVLNSDIDLYCGEKTDLDNEDKKIEVLKKMQLAYSGTTLANSKDDIRRIMNIVTDNSNAEYNADTEKSFASSIVGQVIGKKVRGSNSSSSLAGGSSEPEISRYPGCDTDDITVGSYIIAACNVGTNIAGTGADSYGEYYNFEDASCLEGYHIPSKEDWGNLITIGGWLLNGLQMSNDLILPLSGKRNYDIDNTMMSVGSKAFYWSSTGTNTAGNTYYTYFKNTSIASTYNQANTVGHTVRCFKNPEPINGTCGDDNGGSLTSEPVGLCSTGTASAVTDNGGGSTYDWTCDGANGGDNATCSASNDNPSKYPECSENDIKRGDIYIASCNLNNNTFYKMNNISLCEGDYHIGTKEDFEYLKTYYTNNNINFDIDFPLLGSKNMSTGGLFYDTERGYYWSKTADVNNIGSYHYLLNTQSLFLIKTGSLESGFLIRCFKN